MTTTNQKIFDSIKFSTLLSRLLAQENLNVIFDENVETASFMVSTRTLRFPYNTTMLDSDIHELFILHEVSHALHLPENMNKIIDESNVQFNLFNIIIDIRDERLIKKKYPSAAKCMYAGYKKLIEQNFFGENIVELIKFKSFADRLNVFAKLGPSLASFVPLSKEEYAFYERCMLAETIDECIQLTIELEKLVELEREKLKSLSNEFFQHLEDNDMFHPDATYRDRVSEAEELLEALFDTDTLEELERQRRSKNMNNVSFHTIKQQYDIDCKFIDAKTYYKYLTETADITNAETQTVRDLRTQIGTSVDSMVRIFEMKKAAHRRQNRKISDSGLINPTKIHRYKFDDFIFKETINYPNAKNHGYVILVDFSGSMIEIFQSVVEQLTVITEFFRRINVKYKVIGFGADVNQLIVGDSKRDRYSVSDTELDIPITGVYCELFEVLNSEQNLLEHNTCLFGLFNICGFTFGSTPTGTSMLAIEKIMTEFFNKNNIQKKNLIVMTDGTPTDVRSQYGTSMYSDSITGRFITTYDATSYDLINVLGKVYDYRHGIKFTTISICKQLNNRNTSPFTRSTVTDSSWRADGYAQIKNAATSNSIYFAKPINPECDPTDFTVLDPMATTRKIASQMSKRFKQIKKSRNFLNAIAEHLS